MRDHAAHDARGRGQEPSVADLLGCAADIVKAEFLGEKGVHKASHGVNDIRLVVDRVHRHDAGRARARAASSRVGEGALDGEQEVTERADVDVGVDVGVARPDGAVVAQHIVRAALCVAGEAGLMAPPVRGMERPLREWGRARGKHVGAGRGCGRCLPGPGYVTPAPALLLGWQLVHRVEIR